MRQAETEPIARAQRSVDERWQRALERALDECLDVLTEPARGETFVESATHPGTLYRVTRADCSCAAGVAGQPCKHRACLLAQLGDWPPPAVVAVVDCRDCSGGGVQWYRGGYGLPCETCQGTGLVPEPRPADEPGVPVTAAAA